MYIESLVIEYFSVKTDLMEEGANSSLSIARVGPTDSGNYTCVLTTMPDQPATVHVHVLNGESTTRAFARNFCTRSEEEGKGEKQRKKEKKKEKKRRVFE